MVISSLNLWLFTYSTTKIIEGHLLKQRFLNTAVAIFLVHSGTGVLLKSNPSYAVDIPTTTTSIKKAPFSKVFFTGSDYAVKDKDYKSSEPSIGFFSLWSKNPTNKRLQVAVQYCLPAHPLSESRPHLSAMTILDNNQPIVTINQGVGENRAQLRVVQPGYYTPPLYPSFYGEDPFDDPFWKPLEREFDYVPAVTCSAGSNRFDLTKIAGAIAQLPNRTLQVKLVFSNGEIQNWHLGKKTVQAIKDLLTIR
jgi:hypothetical protein